MLLDVNQLAAGKDYYSVGDYEVTPDNAVLAYADDSNGRRQWSDDPTRTGWLLGPTAGEGATRALYTEVDQTVANLMSLMEPMVILFLGTVIGGLVVSMYLPIFKLGSVIQ